MSGTRSLVAALTRLRRRYQAAVVAAAFLVAAGLVASLVLVMLPDPGTAATHAGTTPIVSTPNSSAAQGATPSRVPVSPGEGSPTGPGARVTLTPASGPARLSGRIRPGATYQGVATFSSAAGDDSCGFGRSGDPMVAALNPTDYEASKACGAYLLVRTASGAAVGVRVIGRCADCATGDLELSSEAFARLAPASTGRADITWTLLSPDLSGPVAVRYRTGSSRSECAVQVLDHRNPIATLELRGQGRWRQLTRGNDDYFASPNGFGCGGSLRITDIYGQHLVLTGISIRPGTVQTGTAQFARH